MKSKFNIFIEKLSNSNNKLISSVFKFYLSHIELFNYLIIGCLSTLINILTKWLLLFTVLNPKKAVELNIAIVVSWIVAFLFAYITNRTIVFESKNKKVFSEFISFLFSRLFTLGMEMFIMWLFINKLEFNTNKWVIIWTLVSQLLVVIFNYIFSKLIVFKK